MEKLGCIAVELPMLVPRLQLPVHPQVRTSHRFLGLLGSLSIGAHRDDRHVPPGRRSARS